MEEHNGSVSQDHYRQFLRDFCEQVSEKADDSNNVPIRFANPHIREDELEGECLEWCQLFLQARNSPDILSAALAHKTYELVSESNLEKFVCEDEGEGDHHDNKAEEEKSQENNDQIKKEYDAEVLHQFVLETLEGVCKMWLEELPNIPVSAGRFNVQFHAIKNTRRKMEDSHTIIPDLNTLFGLKDQPSQSFYGVYDGHAGVDAANYAGRQLHCNLVRQCPLVEDPSAAMLSAFKVTDEAFCSKAKAEHWRSGATGVTALVRGDSLHMAWLGDSQAVLVRDGRSVTHMEPHKPDRQDERDRIESLGGMVMVMGDLWRVGGNIAVSRAIGDASYKPYISSDAEVLTVELDGTEDYLVLACDGLWDAIAEEDLPRIVYDSIIENGGDLSDVAKSLVQYAKDHESTDNISVIIIFFRDQIAEPQSLNLFNFLGSATQDGQQDSGADNSNAKSNNHSSGNNGQEGSKDFTKDINSSGNAENKEQTESSDEKNKVDATKMLGKTVENAENMNTREENMEKYEHLNEALHLLDNYNDTETEGKQISDVDLDYYEVFDSKMADRLNSLSHSHIPNSSDLLRGIASSVYSGQYESMLEKPEGILKRAPDTHHTQAIEKILPRNVKKLKPLPQKPKQDSKLGLATSPICWAFTGRNRATVQNHRLNLAARSSIRNVPGTVEVSKAAKSMSQSFGDMSSAADKIAKENQGIINRKKNTSVPARNVLKNLSTSQNKPVSMVYGSKANIQTEAQKFYTSWRPRRPHKPITSVVYESPPTPFINSKMQASRH